MTSTLTLYYNCLVEPDKNFILDDDGEKAIETYLQTLDSEVIEDFQYIKQALSLSIRIDASQVGLCMGEDCDDLNYCKIQNDDQNPFYYFIIHKNWKSANTIELVLSMDTLNTFQYDSDYEVSPKTLIKRMHKDRFTSFGTQYYRTELETGAYEDVSFEFTNIMIRDSFPTNIECSISPLPLTEPTISVVTINNIRHIRVSFRTTDHTSYSVEVSYKINGLLRVIDLRSEEINCPVYKESELNLYEREGLSRIDWSLYYKTADNQEETPVDCYLVPSEPMSFFYQQASGEFNTGNVPANKYLLFFKDYNNPEITFEIDGVTYTPSSSLVQNVRVLDSIAIFNDAGTIKVYKGNHNNYQGGHGSWVLIATNPTSLKVMNSPAVVYSNEVSSLPSAGTIFSQSLYLQIYAQHSTNMGALIETTIYGNNSIDKTLSTNIKIINIPYSPTPFEVDANNIYTFDDCWSYNSGDGKLKLTDFNKRFSNEITSNDDSILYPFIQNLYQVANLSQDILRQFVDSKLFHSDYYRPKFVYDSFSKVFPLEQMDFMKSDMSLNFKFKFIMTRNIVSKFLFKFDQFSYIHAKEDYENIVAVSRNNEEVLYNSQYLDYIRTGYNYDLKAKERTENASGIGIGLNVASLIASIGIGAITGNPIAIGSAVASGFSLTTQLVNYAKTTAQSEENIQKKLQETQMQAISVMNADDYDLLYAYSENKAKMCRYNVSANMAKALDDLFFYCGYTINYQGKPNVSSRRSFNFLQASLVITHTNNITKELQDDIIEKFENGVTFLHYSFNKFDFNQDKENIELSVL